MVAAVIAGAVPRTVLFASDGSPQSAVSYMAAPGAQLLVDLVPNKMFQVTIDGQRLTTVTSSSQGVATFVVAGGGAIHLE
jgi:hypothetical protein